MEISQLILAKLWLYAFSLGAGLGAVYDALCITRVFLGVPFSPWAVQRMTSSKFPLLKPLAITKRPLIGEVLTFVEDFVFSIAASVSLILLFFGVNEGIVRIPAFFCAALGFTAYRACPGKLLRPLAEILLVISINAVYYIVYFLLYPFHKAFFFLRGWAMHLLRKRMRAWERKQRIRFTKAEWRRIKEDACGML